MQRYMFCNHIVLNATVNVLISYCDECKGKCVNIILWWMQRQRFCYHAEYNGKFIVESASLHSLHASVTGSVFLCGDSECFWIVAVTKRSGRVHCVNLRNENMWHPLLGTDVKKYVHMQNNFYFYFLKKQITLLVDTANRYFKSMLYLFTVL